MRVVRFRLKYASQKIKRGNMKNELVKFMAETRDLQTRLEALGAEEEVVVTFPRGDGNTVQIGGVSGLYLQCELGGNPEFTLFHENSGFRAAVPLDAGEEELLRAAEEIGQELRKAS
jgi:hypothetical protein